MNENEPTPLTIVIKAVADPELSIVADPLT